MLSKSVRLWDFTLKSSARSVVGFYPVCYLFHYCETGERVCCVCVFVRACVRVCVFVRACVCVCTRYSVLRAAQCQRYKVCMRVCRGVRHQLESRTTRSESLGICLENRNLA